MTTCLSLLLHAKLWRSSLAGSVFTYASQIVPSCPRPSATSCTVLFAISPVLPKRKGKREKDMF